MKKSTCGTFLERVCLFFAFCAVIMCFHLFKFKQVFCNKKGYYLGDPTYSANVCFTFLFVLSEAFQVCLCDKLNKKKIEFAFVHSNDEYVRFLN